MGFCFPVRRQDHSHGYAFQPRDTWRLSEVFPKLPELRGDSKDAAKIDRVHPRQVVYGHDCRVQPGLLCTARLVVYGAVDVKTRKQGFQFLVQVCSLPYHTTIVLEGIMTV